MTATTMIHTLTSALEHAAKIEAEARAERLELERALKLARGTREIRPAKTPFWVGDETDTATLAAAVERAIRSRPMLLSEIIEATGARRGRVSGAIIALQRSGVKIVNRGEQKRALWFVPSMRVQRATQPTPGTFPGTFAA